METAAIAAIRDRGSPLSKKKTRRGVELVLGTGLPVPGTPYLRQTPSRNQRLKNCTQPVACYKDRILRQEVEEAESKEGREDKVKGGRRGVSDEERTESGHQACPKFEFNSKGTEREVRDFRGERTKKLFIITHAEYGSFPFTRCALFFQAFSNDTF